MLDGDGGFVITRKSFASINQVVALPGAGGVSMATTSIAFWPPAAFPALPGFAWEK